MRLATLPFAFIGKLYAESSELHRTHHLMIKLYRFLARGSSGEGVAFADAILRVLTRGSTCSVWDSFYRSALGDFEGLLIVLRLKVGPISFSDFSRDEVRVRREIFYDGAFGAIANCARAFWVHRATIGLIYF